MKKGKLLLLVACVLTFVVAVLPVISLADSNELVVYCAIGDKEIAPLQEACKKDTGIDLKALAIPIGQSTTRIKAENGHPQADVQMGGSIDYYQELIRMDLLVPYKSPNTAKVDEKSKDPQGYWTGFYRGVLGLVVNENQFKKELPGVPYPTTWEDLLNPAYKGKIVHTNPASSGAGLTFIGDQIFRFNRDENKAWDFIKSYCKNVGNYQNSSLGPANIIATGEYPIGISWTQDAMMKIDEGYPLKILVPKDTTYELSGIAILKGCQNLKLAQKFIDWTYTVKEGTRFEALGHRYSVVPGVAPPKGMLPYNRLKLIPYDFDYISKNKDRIVKQFTDIMNK